MHGFSVLLDKEHQKSIKDLDTTPEKYILK